MIYVLIAGTYTPFALLVLQHGWRTPILTAAWGGALLARC
jgi:channel protein (hemolysin III family)